MRVKQVTRIAIIALFVLTVSASVRSSNCYSSYDYYENYWNDEAQTQWLGYYFCLCGGQTFTDGQLSGPYRQITYETCNHLHEYNYCQHWNGSAWDDIPCT